MIPFKAHFAQILRKLPQLYTFTGIFVQLFCIRNITIRLYQAARECGHFQVPMPKTQDNKCAKDQQRPLAVPPPKDKYLEEDQSRQTLLIQSNSFKDLQTYLTHHNTYQESQNIHKEYRKRLLDLNDDRYYQEIDHVYETYGPT